MQFDANAMRDYINEDSYTIGIFNYLKNTMTEEKVLEYIFNYSCACSGKVDKEVITCSYRNSDKTFKLCRDCYSYVNGYSD